MKKTITFDEWMEQPDTWKSELDGYGGEDLVLAGWEKAMENNPFCEACEEKDCLIGDDGYCEMIRVYKKRKEALKDIKF